MNMQANLQGWDFEVCVDEHALSRRAAGIAAAAAIERPDLLLCAATGASPTFTYAQMVERAAEQSELFRRLRVLQLDEWAGLPAGDPGTCQTYLRRHLVTPLGICRERYIYFESDSPDPAAECARVRKWLDENGPIDLCVLGLGLNGHIALNEPGDTLQARPHVAALTDQTRQHPMISHASQHITSGLTLGVGDILRSRHILLLVSGQAKRAPLRQLLDGLITTHFPASLLHTHPRVTCLCDRAAAPDGVAQ